MLNSIEYDNTLKISINIINLEMKLGNKYFILYM